MSDDNNKKPAQKYSFMDYHELRDPNSDEGRSAMWARLAGEAGERGDKPAQQYYLQLLEQLHNEIARRGRNATQGPGAYAPGPSVQPQQEQQPVVPGNVNGMAFTGPQPVGYQQAPPFPGAALTQALAPSDVAQAPMLMAYGTGPVPGPAHQGPNHSQSSSSRSSSQEMTAYDQAKKKRKDRDDKGQPKPKKARTSASSEEGPRRPLRIESPARTQGPAGEIVAAPEPDGDDALAQAILGELANQSPEQANEAAQGNVVAPANGAQERSEEDARIDSLFFEEETLGSAQGNVAESDIDPVLLGLVPGQLLADSTIAAPATSSAPDYNDVGVFLRMEQESAQQPPFAPNAFFGSGGDFPAASQEFDQHSFDLSFQEPLSSTDPLDMFDFSVFPAADTAQDPSIGATWDSTQQGFESYFDGQFYDLLPHLDQVPSSRP